jgi:aldehyde dehydrogenase (NAD+)
MADILRAMTGATAAAAEAEVDAAVRRIFWYAAQADKHDGRTAATQTAHLTLALPEPHGVMGLVAPTEAPLLGLVSLILPAIATGNRVVAVPSQPHPLAAVELYRLLDTSDVPAGVVNLVTGPRDELARVLAAHEDVDALWYAGPAEGSRMVEEAAAANLKPTWVTRGRALDWAGPEGQGAVFLDRATRLKTVWVPYGA